MNTAAPLEFEAVLVILDTKLRFYYFLNKHIQTTLEISCSNV